MRPTRMWQEAVQIVLLGQAKLIRNLLRLLDQTLECGFADHLPSGAAVVLER